MRRGRIERVVGVYTGDRRRQEGVVLCTGGLTTGNYGYTAGSYGRAAANRVYGRIHRRSLNGERGMCACLHMVVRRWIEGMDGWPHGRSTAERGCGRVATWSLGGGSSVWKGGHMVDPRWIDRVDAWPHDRGIENTRRGRAAARGFAVRRDPTKGANRLGIRGRTPHHPGLVPRQPHRARSRTGLALRWLQCVNFLYLIRCGWSASAPRRRRRSSS